MSPTPYCVFEYNEAVARNRKLEEGKTDKDETRFYDCLVANSNDPVPNVSVPRFRMYPAMPPPFFRNRRFHSSEVKSRIEALTRVDATSMVHLAGCS